MVTYRRSSPSTVQPTTMIRTTKQLCTFRIPLTDTEYIYSPNFTQFALERTKRNYEGRCVNGYKIVQITSIHTSVDDGLMLTLPTFDNQSTDHSTTFNIICNAEVIMLKKMDLIPECTVVSINPKSILCEWDHGSITINTNKHLQSLRVGQVMPAYVGDSRYTYLKEEIAVRGYAFVAFKPNQPIISAINEPTEEEVKMVRDMYNDGLELYNRVKVDSQFAKFADMLHIDWPVDRNVNEEKVDSSVISLAGLIDKPTKFVATRLGQAGEPTVIQIKSPCDVASQTTWSIAMQMLIDEWVDWVFNCHSLAATYSDKKYKDAGNVWALHAKTKMKLLSKLRVGKEPTNQG